MDDILNGWPLKDLYITLIKKRNDQKLGGSLILVSQKVKNWLNMIPE